MLKALGLGMVGAIVLAASVAAQSVIVPDGTLGSQPSQVSPNFNGFPTEVVTGGAQRGPNLFHSFLEFNVDAGRFAYFLVPDTAIQNILTRVTGSNPSNIFGTLGTRISTADGQFLPSNANLFLINPRGIIFGAGAQLDINGSFAATTTSGVRFGALGEFSATNPQPPGELLTINPSLFFVNQVSPGPITVNQAFLGIPDGNRKTLLLLGGDVVIDGGFLYAGTSSGRVDIGAIGGEGTVPLLQDGNDLQLGVFDHGNRADITLNNQTTIFVSDLTGGGVGSVAMQARQVSLEQGSAIAVSIAENIDSRGSRPGTITVDATGALQLADNSGISLGNNGGIGDLGSISVSGKTVTLQRGSFISSASVGQGNAANITVKAEETLSLTGQSADGTPSFIQSSIGAVNGFAGVGNSGNILIQAPQLILKDSASLTTTNNLARGNAGQIEIRVDTAEVRESRIVSSTFGIGNAGNIVINARDRVFFSGDFANASTSVGQNAVGAGGNIQITTAVLDVLAGARLTSSSFGQGHAGDVVINARDQVTIDGANPGGRFRSQISSAIQPGGVGQGGNVRISTGTLRLSNSGQVTAGTFGQGDSGDVVIEARDRVIIEGTNTLMASSVDRRGVGQGGDIRITTGSLTIGQGAQLIADTNGRGNAGNVVIDARDAVVLDGVSADGQASSGVYSSIQATGIGKGGDIRITTGNLRVSNGAVVTSSTSGQGDGGNIEIAARDRVVLSQGSIFGLVQAGAIGNGATIRMASGALELDQSEISTTAIGSGNAGDIILAVNGIASLRGSLITSNVGSPLRQPTVGNVGNLSLTAQSVLLSENSQFQAGFYANTQGKAGLVSVQAKDAVVFIGKDTGIFTNAERNVVGNGSDIQISAGSVSLLNGAVLVSSSSGNGNAGNVVIQGRDFVQLQDGKIATDSLNRSGGDLWITAPVIRLLGNSDLLTTVNLGNGKGGNITLSADSIIALNDSDILTFALEGQGGDITLQTRAFFGQNYRPALLGTNPQTLDGNNRVDINASGSIFGIITLPDVSFLQNGLNQLPNTQIDTNALLANSCIVRTPNRNNSFYITGSSSLPLRPGDPPAVPYPTGELRAVVGSGQSSAVSLAPRPPGKRWQKGDPIVEPDGIYQLPDGQLILSRECSDH